MRTFYKSTFFKIIAFTFVSSVMSCTVETPPSPPKAPVVVVPPVVVTPPVVTPPPPPPPPIITEPIPANGIFTTRVILEDHTGTWCGHCPRLSKRLDDAVLKYPNIIGVAIHNGDDMASEYDRELITINGVVGFPTGVINRNLKWNENTSAFPPFLGFQRTIGVGIESNVIDNTISGKVKVHNGKNYTESYQLHIILVEDKLYYNQSNFGYNNEPNPIVKKEHNDVLRQYATKVAGEDIPATNKTAGNVYERTFSFNAKGYDIKNCRIIAYISEAKAGIINANKVVAGKSQVAD